MTGCKNFVGKRKKFIFNAFVDFKPGERFENGSDNDLGALTTTDDRLTAVVFYIAVQTRCCINTVKIKKSLDPRVKKGRKSVYGITRKLQKKLFLHLCPKLMRKNYMSKYR